MTKSSPRATAPDSARSSDRSRLRSQRPSVWFRHLIVPHSIRQLAATGVTCHAIEGPQPKAQIVTAYRSTEFSKVVPDFLEIGQVADEESQQMTFNESYLAELWLCDVNPAFGAGYPNRPGGAD
jgi:hypothetical protein